MQKPIGKRLTAASIAFFVGLSAPAEANFWEALFGRAVVAPTLEFDPLNVTVRARPKKAKAASAPREEPVIAREWPMDFRTDPHWYLRDHTLARGDIIVLPNRVVVFDGGEARHASFRPYETSKAISVKSRQAVKHLTSAPQDRSVVWEPAAASSTRAVATASGTVTGRR